MFQVKILKLEIEAISEKNVADSFQIRLALQHEKHLKE